MRWIAPLLLAAAVSAQERQTVVVDLAETPSADSVPRVTFPKAVFTLGETRPGGLDGLPELTEAARFGSASIGGRTLPFAFDAPEGAFALGLCYGGAGEPVRGRARPLRADELAVDFFGVPKGVTRWNVRLVYQGLNLAEAQIEPTFHRRGRAVIHGAVREVLLVDGDGDARYDGPDDRWIALRLDRVSKVNVLRRAESFLLKEPQIPFLKGGLALTVEKVAADGSTLVLVADRPTTDPAEVLARRYREVREAHFADFRAESREFTERMGLDPARPRAAEPAPWLEVPLSEAKTRAKREGKPLLVFFFAETNEWCYRYDYYTFPDREVDRLLRRFVLVRIDVEKDAEHAYQRVGARSLPTLVPFTTAGGPISFTLRHTGEGQPADLPEPEKMISVWQRPQELATNLKRILAASD